MTLLLLACAEPDTDTGAGGGDDTAPVAYEHYACGWEKRDPGTLASTGNAVGDVIADLTVVDQCGEDFRLWDTFGADTLLYVTAAWCGPCLEETSHLAEAQATWADDGLDIGIVVVLYADTRDHAPPDDASVAADYAEAIGVTDEFVVAADMTGTIRDQMPWTDALPGKCALSPSLEMLDCWNGETNDPLLAAYE